jgi:hypothetical protein
MARMHLTLRQSSVQAAAVKRLPALGDRSLQSRLLDRFEECLSMADDMIADADQVAILGFCAKQISECGFTPFQRQGPEVFPAEQEQVENVEVSPGPAIHQPREIGAAVIVEHNQLAIQNESLFP